MPHNHKSVIASLKEAQRDVEAGVAVLPREKKTVVAAPQAASVQKEENLMNDIQDDGDGFDLDAELQKAMSAAEEAQQEPEEVEAAVPTKSPEESLHDQVKAYLHASDNAPSEADIDGWKRKHGKHSVHVVAFAPDHVYVFRHLTGGEWDKIQQLSEQKRKAGADPSKAMKESIVRQGVLWPKLDVNFFANSPAGIPDTLSDSILAASYFLRPEVTFNLTTSL